MIKQYVSPKPCNHCGRIYTPRIQNINSGNGKYCSYRCSNASRAVDPKIRFSRLIEKTDGCWIYKGHIDRGGYGLFKKSRTPNKTVSAHRFAYESEFGPIPAGLMVCHHCDNRVCVRPDHLFLGTAKDNMQDAFRKGRLAHQKRRLEKAEVSNA